MCGVYGVEFEEISGFDGCLMCDGGILVFRSVLWVVGCGWLLNWAGVVGV